MNNHRVTAGVAGLALSVLVVGCSTTSTGPGEGVADVVDADSGAKIVYAADLEPTCLDPHQNGQIGNAIITQNIAESLVYQNEEGSFDPWLATAWEISDDRTEYTFTLREGVTFHNGEPFNADAVIANMEYWTDPETKSTAGLSLGYTGGESLEEHSVVLRFERPQDAILQGLSLSSGGMLAPASLTDKEALCAGQNFFGTGPFELTSYTKGQDLTLGRYDDYVGGRGATDHEGPAYLEEVQIRFLPEAGARLGALSSDQAQIVANVPVTDAPTVDTSADESLEKAPALGASYALNLNTQRAPFDDPQVRRALQIGLNIDAAVQGVYQGYYDRAWSPVVRNTPPTGAYAADLEETWDMDRDEAGRLLDAAGWDEIGADGIRVKDGERLSVTWLINGAGMKEQRDVLGEALAADAAELGFEIERRVVDAGTFTTELREENYDISDISLQRAEADLLVAQYHSSRTPANAGYNYSLLDVPEIDALLDIGVVGDTAERADAFSQVQHFLVEEAVVIPIYDPAYLAGTRADYSGFRFTTAGYPDWFYDIVQAK